MATLVRPELEHAQMSKLAGPALRQQIVEMLTNSSQCQAIFECVNHESGEYRIVLHGILDKTTEN